jgi:hypothetical protein
MDREQLDRLIDELAYSREEKKAMLILSDAILAAQSAPEPEIEIGEVIDYNRRLLAVVNKAQGIVRTAYVPASGEIKVVRQWWSGLVDALVVLDSPTEPTKGK